MVIYLTETPDTAQKNKTKTSHYSKATEMNNSGLYKTSGDILQRYKENALS